MVALRFFWRPSVVGGPGVAASLKCCGFFDRQSAFVVQPEGEPGRFNFLAEKNAGIAVKRNVSKRFAGTTTPTAVIPRAAHQGSVIFLVGFVQEGGRHHGTERIL